MDIIYTPSEIAKILNAQIQGSILDENLRILLTDSRQLSSAGQTLFFALKTEKNDGHKFIPHLIRSGVKCFVISHGFELAQTYPEVCFLCVEDTLKALQELATHHRKRFTIPVLGITGSNGKTIVKEWLTQILADKMSVVKSPRSYNSQIGVPLSVWELNNSHQMAIFEAGISTANEMDALRNIMEPEIGILTNIGAAHDAGFTNRDHKLKEKLKLFEKCKVLIYRSDNIRMDAKIRQWAAENGKTKLFYWGQKCAREKTQGHWLRLVSMEKKKDKTRINLLHLGRVYNFTIPFGDEASVENALHCIAVLLCLGHNPRKISEKVLELKPLSMRMEMKQAINSSLLIDDAYSSDLTSLQSALNFLSMQAKGKHKTLVLSDLLQSGIEPERLYERIGEMLKNRGIDRLVGIGKKMSLYKDSFSIPECLFYPDTESFLQNFDADTFQNTAILLKGAREFGFERISRKLQLADHRTLLEINLDALIHNLNIYKGILHRGTKIMAMVKAFSYGSGSFEIANTLQYQGIDYLAVAFADEGKALRKAGINMPIMVLNPEVHNLDILFTYKLEPEIYSTELLLRFLKEPWFAKPKEASPFPIHIKLDTGMHRLGFQREEMNSLISILKNHSNIKVQSVFSHLAASDMSQHDHFTQNQITLFNEMCQELHQALGYDFDRHIANSAAINRFPESHLSMVRLGIGMYGIDSSTEIQQKLQNVTTFKSVISQIKIIKKGESVGYGRSAIANTDKRIAIVPVGYADGLSRSLSNGQTFLLINGQKAYTYGSICMDMCMLDVTDLKASAGDEVIIFGEQRPAQELAKSLNTIPYEVLTSVSARVKRIYYRE